MRAEHPPVEGGRIVPGMYVRVRRRGDVLVVLGAGRRSDLVRVQPVAGGRVLEVRHEKLTPAGGPLARPRPLPLRRNGDHEVGDYVGHRKVRALHGQVVRRVAHGIYLVQWVGVRAPLEARAAVLYKWARPNPAIDSLEAAQKRYHQLARMADPANNASPTEQATARRMMEKLVAEWPGCDAPERKKSPFDDILEALRRAQQARGGAAGGDGGRYKPPPEYTPESEAPPPKFRVGAAVYFAHNSGNRRGAFERVQRVLAHRWIGASAYWQYTLENASKDVVLTAEPNLRPATREELEEAKAEARARRERGSTRGEGASRHRWPVGTRVRYKGDPDVWVIAAHAFTALNAPAYALHGVTHPQDRAMAREEDLVEAERGPTAEGGPAWRFALGERVEFVSGLHEGAWIVIQRVPGAAPAYHLRKEGGRRTQTYVAEMRLRPASSPRAAPGSKQLFPVGSRVGFRAGRGPGSVYVVLEAEYKIWTGGKRRSKGPMWCYRLGVLFPDGRVGPASMLAHQLELRKARPGEAYTQAQADFGKRPGTAHEGRTTGSLPPRFAVGLTVELWDERGRVSGGPWTIGDRKYDAKLGTWLYNVRGIGWVREGQLRPAPAASPPPPPPPPPSPSAASPGWTKRGNKYTIDGSDKWFGTQAAAEAYVRKHPVRANSHFARLHRIPPRSNKGARRL